MCAVKKSQTNKQKTMLELGQKVNMSENTCKIVCLRQNIIVHKNHI